MSLRGSSSLHRNNVVCRVKSRLHLFLGFGQLRGRLKRVVVKYRYPDVTPTALPERSD
jgi:hypothetical protein